MTIIAGFRCDEGIVVCADTQETLAPAKRSVPKLRFEPCNQYTQEEDNHSNLAVAFCGAGTGPMIDKLIDAAWSEAKKRSNLNDACASIEASIKKQYKEYGRIYQPGSCPEVQLIYGVKMDGESRLFSAFGPIVNEKFEFDSGGQGHYMADFLASRTHYRQLSVNQCAILAAYVLYQAKEHVEGCGGDSQVAVLRNKGTCGTVSWFQERPLTELIHLVDDITADIFMALADIDKSDEKVSEDLQFQLGVASMLRNSCREDLRKGMSEEMIKSRDFLGLPVPREKEK